jgi:hypothetical protein
MSVFSSGRTSTGCCAGSNVVGPDDQGHCHSTAFPGFWLDPDWFWQDPLPNVDRLMMRIAPEAYWRYLTRLREEESAHP